MKTHKYIFASALATLLLYSHFASAHTKLQLDSIPDDTPNLVNYSPLSVDVAYWQFEISGDQTRARVHVEYNVSGPGTGDYTPVLDPTLAELPNLAFNKATGQLVYNDNGTPVVCANVAMKHGVFGTHMQIKNTGACRVVSTHTKHKDSSGFEKRRYTSLDVYLDVQ